MIRGWPQAAYPHDPEGRPVPVVRGFRSERVFRYEDSEDQPLRRNGTRSVSIVLPPGEHRFRYLADGVWLDEETADMVDAEGS